MLGIRLAGKSRLSEGEVEGTERNGCGYAHDKVVLVVDSPWLGEVRDPQKGSSEREDERKRVSRGVRVEPEKLGTDF